MTKFQKKLWIGLVVMAILSPLGIYLPRRFGTEDAWGEWGVETIRKMLGYVPEGMRKMADFWKAPVADYNFGGTGAAFSIQALSYIISGLIGIVVVGAVLYVLSRLLIKKKKANK